MLSQTCPPLPRSVLLYPRDPSPYCGGLCCSYPLVRLAYAYWNARAHVILQVHKTKDDKVFCKLGDLAQMVVCRPKKTHDPGEEDVDVSVPTAWPHGEYLTTPVRAHTHVLTSRSHIVFERHSMRHRRPYRSHM